MSNQTGASRVGPLRRHRRLFLAILVSHVGLLVVHRWSTLPGLSFNLNVDLLKNATHSDMDSLNWWRDCVDNVAVTFEKWKGQTYSWCVEDSSNDSSLTGLILSKTFKTGSSTAAALTLRISHRVAQRYLKQHHCKTFLDHSFMRRNLHSFREQPSLLWTIVRNPAKRAISSINYFQVGLHGKQFSDQEMITRLSKLKNVQLQQIRDFKGAVKPALTSSILNSTQNVIELMKQSVFNKYDFIAVNERWEESVAVMQLLFDLEDEDMIVLSAKRSGSWAWNVKEGEESRCFVIPRATQSDKVKIFLQTDFTYRNADFLLHAVANKSLDLTIDSLGRDLVATKVNILRYLQELVERNCLNSTVFPCASNGTYQSQSKDDCYWRDMGCGFRCIDRVLSRFDQG